MTREDTVREILTVIIDALGKEVDPASYDLYVTINEACKANRAGHLDRYNNKLEEVRKLMHFNASS